MWYRFLCAVLLFTYSNPFPNRLKANIMMMYSSNGSVAFISDQYTLGAKWRQLLDHKVLSVPTWPFEAIIELYDCYSDPVLTTHYLSSRIHDRTKPPVTAIIGAETNLLGDIAAHFGSVNDIPVLLAITNPDPENPVLPPFYNNSFLIEPPAQYQFRELVNIYVDVGVQTLVAVQMYEKYNSYNRDSCYGAATLAASRGIRVVAHVTLFNENSTEEIRTTIANIRDQCRPDAIVWCDWASCALPTNVQIYNPLSSFRDLNYVPKALSFLDCIDEPNVAHLKQQGLYLYTSAPQFVNEKLRGQEYTEDFTPYASHFRPSTEIKTVTDLINLGATKASPSSTKLFFDWYHSVTNHTATYQTVMSWAAVDLLESALYRACAIATSKPYLAATDVLEMLRSSQASTPAGRVSFDGSNVNSPQASIFIQELPSSDTAEIVGPSNLQTALFVYPMPTWDERVYRWYLITPDTVIPLAIASICSLIMGVIAVTFFIHRDNSHIKMVNAWHVMSMCGMSCIVFWGLVFLWQSDMTQIQCNAYLWLSYLPASYLIMLTNMKAYRLSLFIRASIAKRSVKTKPVSHAYVMYGAWAQCAGTIFILMIAQVGDPGISTNFVADIHRPMYNQHHCVTGHMNPSLLYTLVTLPAPLCVYFPFVMPLMLSKTGR